MSKKKQEREYQEVLEPNRLYKNNFFQRIYERDKYLLEVASFLAQKEVRKSQVANVKPILLGNRQNDLSVIVDDVFYCMLEAQSTWNPNMPFRLLNYILTALLKLVEQNELYEDKLVRIKVPKLFTVFTGLCTVAPAEVVGELRLSDAFAVKQEAPDVEAIVHTFHFNMTRKETAAYIEEGTIPVRLRPFSDNSLLWYAMFTNSVDYYYKVVLKDRPEAGGQAVAWLCELFKARGIFVDLFEDKEVINMTVMDFSYEDELKYVARKEGREEGREEGIIVSIKVMADLGVSKPETVIKIAKMFDLPLGSANALVEEFY